MIKRFVNYIGDTQNWGKLRILFYIILAVVFISDFFVHRHHVEFIWDKIPGWSAFYGFLSCIVLIIVSKALAHAWLYKEEDYYD